MSAPSRKSERQIYHDIRAFLEEWVEALRSDQSVTSQGYLDIGEYEVNKLADSLTDYAYPLQDNR